MVQVSRRRFLKTGVATGALAGVGSLPLAAERTSASDWVTLGKSNIKVTRLAFGTGTHNGAVQRSSARTDSRILFATPTTTASASSRPLPPTLKCTRCSASR